MTDPLFDRDHFNAAMATVIEDALSERDVMDRDVVPMSPAVAQLIERTAGVLPDVLEQLYREHGDPEANPLSFVLQAAQEVVGLAFDYGFRAGRIYQVRSWGKPLPGKDFPTPEEDA